MAEVAIALGIIAFALLTLMALLPLGLQSNKISAEETRAVCILSALEADLRNSYPGVGVANPKSRIFGLTLPYRIDSSTNYLFYVTAPTTTLTEGETTVGLADDDTATNFSERRNFQASVIYTSVPTNNSAAAMQARLVVNWPAVGAGALTNVTESPSLRGSVEAVVSFPAP